MFHECLVKILALVKIATPETILAGKQRACWTEIYFTTKRLFPVITKKRAFRNRIHDWAF